jgi:integrase
VPKAHLTDIAVARLRTPGTYFDDTTPAFGIRVGKHRKTWIVMRGKERVRTKIGHYPTVSLADARKQAKALLTEVPTKNERVTFDMAYEVYKRESLPSKKQRTQDDYKRVLEKHLQPELGRKRLSEISYEDVAAIADGLSKSDKRHCLAVGRTFFRWCVRPPRRYIPHSPLEGVQLAPAGKRKHVLEDPQLKSVWDGAANQGYPHGTIVQLLIITGQRRGEIANLRWPWINEKERVITLPEWVTKNSKEHIFPYGDLVAGILAEVPRRNSTELLFPSRASDERPLSGWSKYKKQLDELAGAQGYTLHDLRRTYRTIHGAIGTPANIGERLINHVAAVTTEVELIYDRHTYLAEMRTAVERWEARFAAILAADYALSNAA